MKIDGALLDYLYNRDCLYKGILSCLRVHFNITSEVDVKGFYSFLMTKQISSNLTQDELEGYYSEWKERNASLHSNMNSESYNMELNNNLSSFYNQNAIVPRDEILEETWSTLCSGRDSSSLLYLCINSVRYHRILLNWKTLNKRDILECNDKIRSIYTKSIIKNVSDQAKLMATMSKNPDRKLTDGLIKSFLFKDLPLGIKNYIVAYYGNGFDFDYNNPSSIANAISFLYSFTLPMTAGIGNFQLLIQAAAYKGITTQDPFLNYEIIQEANTVLSVNDTTNEGGENETAEKTQPHKQSKGGRGKGTWHTDVNKLEDVIWSSIFSKIWNGRLKKMISEYKLNGRKTEQRLRDIPLLGAAHLYLALKKEGLAKAYGENGTKNSFYKAVKEAFSYRRPSLDEYMLLIDLVDNINIAIENEHQNDNFKNQGYEKADQGADGEVSMQGKMRIAKGNASLVWAPELAAFRKEHYELYSLLGDDILSADYTVEKDLEDYPNNNIHNMIETLSWLQREIHREYSNLTSK